MNPKYEYILTYFRQTYNLPDKIDIGYGTGNHKINIHDCQTRYYETVESFPQNQIVWKEWKDKKIPFLFAESDSRPVLEIKDGQAFINYDILAASFFFLSGWQEYVYMNRHSAIRYPYTDSLQFKLGINHLPVVNYYFDILKTAIEQTHNISLKPVAWGKNPFAIALTHDIDKCFLGWRQDFFHELKHRRLASALRIWIQRLIYNHHWFNFDKIIEMEEKYGANSSFYFIARKGRVFIKPPATTPSNDQPNELNSTVSHPNEVVRTSPAAFLKGFTTLRENADYDLNSRKIRLAFQMIQRAKSEVGIHGSWGSHLSERLLRAELRRFPFSVAGGRFHYLNFDIRRTFDFLEEAQLSYDSSLGFAEAAGFRNGIAFPFIPYNIKEDRPYRLLELPLTAMDTTFRVYTKTQFDEILPQVFSIMDEVHRFAGCLTVLWHNAYFSPYKFSGWGEIYEEILKEGQRRNALLLSGEQVYQRWQPLLNDLHGLGH